MLASTLSSVLWLGSLVLGPPTLPPEPAPPSEPPSSTNEPPPSQPPAPLDAALPIVVEPPSLPPGIEAVEFPLETTSGVPPSEPLPRMEPEPSGAAPPRRSIVELRDPFERPSLRPRSNTVALAQQRLLMPDLKDPFAEGTRPVRSRTLDLQVPNDLRDPFRDGLGRKRVAPCLRTTGDGTPVQAPGAPPPECPAEGRDELLDPFREAKAGPR